MELIVDGAVRSSIEHARVLLDRRVCVLRADDDVAPGHWRAAMSAASVDVDAASSM
jgi:hypothetical protein